MIPRVVRKGSTLITCTLILVIVSVFAVGLAAVSGVNLQVADNQHWANAAFASAESGLDVSRYWLDQIRIPSSTPPTNYLGAVIAAVDSNLADHGIDNFRVEPSGAIPAVVLHSQPGYTFQGQWSPTDRPDVMRATTCGTSGLMSRTIIVNYRIEPYIFTIFRKSTATKGPIVIERNASFNAANEPWEADVYIESKYSLLAVNAGMHAVFGGDVLWGNPDATVSAGSSLTAVGEVRPLNSNEVPPEFPVPDVNRFRQYATGPVIDSTTDLSGASTTWPNALIKAGTNPRFTGNVTLQGILYIEAPNKVTFTKNLTLQGMIVGQGQNDLNNLAGNQINIGDPLDPKTPSNFTSGPYPEGSQFDAIRQEVGSCVLAPGFEVSFWKNFTAINGVIAASGLHFDKNATATVQGTLINYSDKPLYIGNNIVLNFDRSNMIDIPAGFDLYRVPIYDPGSYALAY